MATTKNDDQPRVDTTGTPSDNPTAGQNEAIRAFTPGPWEVTRTAGPWSTVRADGHEVADVWNNPNAAGQVHANANLIAAAPDLYAALKAIEETCPCDPDINAGFEAAWQQDFDAWVLRYRADRRGGSSLTTIVDDVMAGLR